jgi:polyisoprenoid-binding protein YceI
LTPYEIKPSPESTFTLEVFKTGLQTGKKHFLFFEQYAGAIDYNHERPESSQVRFSVEAKSVTCKDQWVKPADRKKIVQVAVNDMLAAAQHPQLTFTSTRIAAKPRGQYEIQGNLTIRGVSKPITFLAAVKPIGDHRLEIDGDAEISLKDYDLKPPSSMAGLIGAKDKMTIRFLVWAEKNN